MEHLERLQRAQLYMDQLAQGIDPLTGRELPKDTLLNQPQLIRCFFFVANILKDDVARLEQAGRPKGKKIPEFYLTPDERSRVPISETPVTGSVLVQAINETVNVEAPRKRLTLSPITAWLMKNGFLQEVETAPGKRRKTVTPQSALVGIEEGERWSASGIYPCVLYTADAQNFVLDHMQDIMKLKAADCESKGSSF